MQSEEKCRGTYLATDGQRRWCWSSCARSMITVMEKTPAELVLVFVFLILLLLSLETMKVWCARLMDVLPLCFFLALSLFSCWLPLFLFPLSSPPPGGQQGRYISIEHIKLLTYNITSNSIFTQSFWVYKSTNIILITIEINKSYI